MSSNNRINQLIKTKKILEQRLHNFERRNEKLEGNFVNRVINLKRRIEEINIQINENIIEDYEIYDMEQ